MIVPVADQTTQKGPFLPAREVSSGVVPSTRKVIATAGSALTPVNGKPLSVPSRVSRAV